jgi:hypothetical protein
MKKKSSNPVISQELDDLIEAATQRLFEVVSSPHNDPAQIKPLLRSFAMAADSIREMVRRPESEDFETRIREAIGTEIALAVSRVFGEHVMNITDKLKDYNKLGRTNLPI